MLQYAQAFNHLCQYAGHHVDTDAKKRERFHRGLNTKLQERLNLVRADSFNDLVNLAITRRILSLHTALKRSARHLLDPRVPLHRGIALCRILQLHPLRRPLSQGVGSFGLHSSSRLDSYHLNKLIMLHRSSSRLVLGRIFSRPLALTIIIAV